MSILTKLLTLVIVKLVKVKESGQRKEQYLYTEIISNTAYIYKGFVK